MIQHVRCFDRISDGNGRGEGTNGVGGGGGGGSGSWNGGLPNPLINDNVKDNDNKNDDRRYRLRVDKHSLNIAWADHERYNIANDLTLSKICLGEGVGSSFLVSNLARYLQQKQKIDVANSAAPGACATPLLTTPWRCIRLDRCTTTTIDTAGNVAAPLQHLWDAIGRSRTERLEIIGDEYEMHRESDAALAVLKNLQQSSIKSLLMQTMLVASISFHERLSSAIRSNANSLTSLEIIECKVLGGSGTAACAIAAALRNATRLERLDLSHTRFSTSADFVDMLEAIHNDACANLIQLDVSGCCVNVDIDDDDDDDDGDDGTTVSMGIGQSIRAIRAIAKFITNMPSLRRLYLSGINRTGSPTPSSPRPYPHISLLTDALTRTSTAFEYVDLSDNLFVDDDVLELLNGLASSDSFVSMDCLNLRNNPLTDQSLRRLSNDGTISRLPVRNLWYPCGGDTDGARALSESLRRPPNRLQRCFVTLSSTTSPYSVQIRHWSTLNAGGRHLLLSSVPLGLWPHVLAANRDSNDVLFHLLHGPAMGM